MKWNDKIEKKPDRQKEEWTTNARIYDEWCRHVKRRGAKNTQRNHVTYGAVFTNNFDVPVTRLNRDDIQAFVDRIGTKCAKLMNGKVPQCLANQPVVSCPLLSGAAVDTCQRYQPLEPTAVWSYICTINRMYGWLLEEERVATNPALPVMRDYASKHAALFDERRRKPRRRIVRLAEVRLLVAGSPPHHSIAYLALSKCFLRVHEVLKLSWDADHCNLEEGWMDLPPCWELGDKRLGNPRIILDAELVAALRTYRAWWEDHVKRDANGAPVTQRVLITVFGKPWGKAAIHNFNTALHKRCIALKLMTGTETQRKDRISTHSFRAFATSWARDAGIGTADLQTLRGDLSPGSIVRYDDYLRRLPELYRAYGPVIGLGSTAHP